MNITDIFVDYLYGLSVSDLRAEAVEQARLCLLDYKGVTAAGAKILQKQGNTFLDYVLFYHYRCTNIRRHFIMRLFSMR